MGFFDRIKQSLTRTKEQFVERFEEVVQRADEPAKRSQPIDVETVEALEEALISADVGVAATDQIVAAVRAKESSFSNPSSSRPTQGDHPQNVPSVKRNAGLR